VCETIDHTGRGHQRGLNLSGFIENSAVIYF